MKLTSTQFSTLVVSSALSILFLLSMLLSGVLRVLVSSSIAVLVGFSIRDLFPTHSHDAKREEGTKGKDNDKENVYNLTNVDIPPMSGPLLPIMCGVLRLPIIGRAISLILAKNAGFLRAATTKIEDDPTYIPVPLVPYKPEKNDIPLEKIVKGHSKKSPFPSIRDYHEAYLSGKVTPIDVVRNLLEGVEKSEKLEKPLRMFISQNKADILKQAEESTKRYKEKKPLSILDGIPVSVKDCSETTVYPATAGTKFLSNIPTKDATIFSRMKEQGAINVGKTNMHEIGCHPNGSNVHHGQCRNPYDLRFDTGGSSSGSACSVASGINPVSIGADGGGSIRVPSALTGMVGLKPTWSRISTAGTLPGCWSVIGVGPISANVEDCAIAYAASAGYDPLCPSTILQPPVSIEKWNSTDLNGIRIGYFKEWFEHASPEVVEANQKLLDQFVSSKGAKLVPFKIEDMDLMRVAHGMTILAEMQANRLDEFTMLAPSVQMTMGSLEALTPCDFVWAQRVRTNFLKQFEKVYKECDIIITPGTGSTAPLIPENIEKFDAGWFDVQSVTDVMRYMFTGNFLGFPAITFPVGYDKKGLPISMQAMGDHWKEDICLRVAHVAESMVERRLPQHFFPSLK